MSLKAFFEVSFLKSFIELIYLYYIESQEIIRKDGFPLNIHYKKD
jgi:hypothetical protein